MLWINPTNLSLDCHQSKQPDKLNNDIKRTKQIQTKLKDRFPSIASEFGIRYLLRSAYFLHKEK